MGFIEGIGDEVAVFGVILLVLILAATFTFILNYNPVSERHLTQPTPHTAASHQNRASPEQEQSETPSNHLRTRNLIHHDSVSDPVSSTTSDEPDSVEPNDESVPESNCHSTTCPTASNNSKIYPEIPEETVSGNVSEDAEENEDSTTEPGLSHIRLKYLNDTERAVTSSLTATIGEFKRTHFAEDLANNKVVRLIYAGQRLQDNATLQSYGVADGCVVHVQVVEAQVPQSSLPNQNTELDLSRLLWPLLSVILGICWILYFKYPEFFNYLSLGILFLFTGSFIYFYSQVQLH